MYETIKEGKVTIKIKKVDKVSREMEVFYNPVMKLNRDISILLLNSIRNKGMHVALPLAGSGIRGIRFLKELSKGKIKSISFNDYDEKATKAIKDNLRLNNVKKFSIIKNIATEKNKRRLKLEKIRIYNDDASLFLLNSKGFDYIDVDPFGSSNVFLDAAVKRISREGILAVTNTDTAALTGTYPKVCYRKYWSKAKLDYLMHETGLRILTRKVQLIGMQYEKALIPMFSYFKDHYFRIFFRCNKGKKECDKISKEHGMFNDAGPMWLGKLWDKKLVNKIFSQLNNAMKNKKPLNKKDIKSIKIKINENYNELFKFLKVIKEESKINSVGFIDTHKMKKISKKEDLIKGLKKKGHKASSTHFLGTGIRTDKNLSKFNQ